MRRIFISDLHLCDRTAAEDLKRRAAIVSKFWAKRYINSSINIKMPV